jgi:hypothetical protein
MAQKSRSRTITFQVQEERDKDIWLWLNSMNYGQPSKTIRTLLGVVAKAWVASAPNPGETMEAFVEKKMGHDKQNMNLDKQKKSSDKQTPDTSIQAIAEAERTQQTLSKSLAAALLEMDKDFG